jgi:N-acetylmuramoyl-L-alanine amidase
VNLKQLDPAAVKYIVVHCSATPPKQDIGATEIDRMHRQRGWLKIGYHFVIRRNGEIENGRTLNEVGAHVEGYNEESVAVCLVGGVDKTLAPVDNFTEEQMVTLASLVEALRDLYPEARVVGHRDFPGVKKACPCFDVQNWWMAVDPLNQ